MPTTRFANLSRRSFFATSGAAAVALAAPVRAETKGDTFQFEITRTEQEWRERLGGIEYAILRDGRTEPPKSSPLWEETRPGDYHCKGCDLHVYEGTWKVVLDKGWVFCEVMNRMEDLGDGKIYEEPNLTILHYAGNGLFSYEEDAYNPHNMGQTIGAWIEAKKAAQHKPC